jgi:hypothetical protein
MLYRQEIELLNNQSPFKHKLVKDTIKSKRHRWLEPVVDKSNTKTKRFLK